MAEHTGRERGTTRKDDTMSDFEHRIGRITAAIYDTPWAIVPEKLAAILSVLDVRANGTRLSDDEIRAAIGTQIAQPPVRAAVGGVGLLPVFGVLGQRMNLALNISGGTSTEKLAADFRQLLADDGVSAIVLAIDSPGGSVYGIDEPATTIRAARGTKPIVAAISSLGASAAYWIAAQADRIAITPGGDAGSIGVITCHEDLSAAQEKLGVKTTLISAGQFKGEGHPFAPLSDDARAALQHRVDDAYRRFVAAVAAGRGVSESSVRDGYGQGRLLSARDALACGLVDEIATLDEVIADVAATVGARAPGFRSSRSTPQDRAVARGTGQDFALDHWQRNLALELRLLDL